MLIVLHVCGFVCWCTSPTVHMRGEGTTCKRWFISSTTWVQGIKLKLSGLTEGAFTQTHNLLCSPYHSESVSFHNLQQITRPVWEEQIYIGSNKRNAYSSSPIGWVGDSNKYYHERLYHDESCGIPQNQRAPSCTRVGPDSSFLLKVQELGN